MSTFNDAALPGKIVENPGETELTPDLPRHPFLASMAPAHSKRMAACARVMDFQPGDLVFKQGDPARQFYLILWGAVDLSHAGMKGNVHLQTLSAGDVLGWSWLFPPYAWHFNALATETTRMIVFDAVQLRQMGDDDPAFGYELMRRVSGILIQRLQWTRRKLMKATDSL
jgi:CRP/FNR family transcriptional regulator, cyclic AMP receptor protein